MIVPMEDLIEEIGHALYECVREHRGWVEARVEAEADAGLVVYKVLLKNEDGSVLSLPGDEESEDHAEALGDLHHDLHDRFAAHGEEPWAQSFFTLTPDGKVNLQFRYASDMTSEQSMLDLRDAPDGVKALRYAEGDSGAFQVVLDDDETD